MAGVLLVFQVGQPRIWMSMSRDGLLPPRFSRLHPKYKTPAFSTVITGIMVAVPALFTNLTEMTDLTSIGTLFAFVLVTGGVILLDKSDPEIRKGFRIPYMNSRVWVPVLLLPAYVALFMLTSEFSIEAFMGERLPVLIYFGVAVLVMIVAVIRRWSFIPVVGLLINLYLMSELGVTNWMRFLIWLVIGLVVYFTYGNRKSKLRRQNGT
ncbi:putative amino acid permease YhdG [bioreactor metagenome]|uniref:Putative amino acid permease YhdG n=1 Tax=bioreactor metagenome TaxID=1076179 RepID=A0A645FD40_9ZZZZ